MSRHGESKNVLWLKIGESYIIYDVYTVYIKDAASLERQHCLILTQRDNVIRDNVIWKRKKEEEEEEENKYLQQVSGVPK